MARRFASVRGGKAQFRGVTNAIGARDGAAELLAGLRVRGFERNHIVAAKTGDGAGQHGPDVFAQTNFVGDIPGKALVGRAPHVSQGLLDAGFRENI